MRGTDSINNLPMFKSGDVLSITQNLSMSGYLTSNKTEVDFTIPLPMYAPSTLTVTLSGRIFSRGATGGYSLNNLDVSNFSGTLRVYNAGTFLRVQLTNLDTAGIVDPNNTAMSIMLVNGFTIAFN